jgi:hypothetical protein
MKTFIIFSQSTASMAAQGLWIAAALIFCLNQFNSNWSFQVKTCVSEKEILNAKQAVF